LFLLPHLFLISEIGMESKFTVYVSRKSLASVFGIELELNDCGLLVKDVGPPASPAIQCGDVIIKVNGFGYNNGMEAAIDAFRTSIDVTVECIRPQLSDTSSAFCATSTIPTIPYGSSSSMGGILNRCYLHMPIDDILIDI
jgi:hypothetical protein